MKKLVFSIMFLVLFVSLAHAQSAPTRLIPFQARLTDATNNSVPDNVYNIVFVVYNAPTGGGSIWTESHQHVSVMNGQINVLLGSLAEINFDFKSPRYLGITIGNGPEMVPRHQLVPSFHSQSSNLAYDSELLDGKDSSFYASKANVDLQIQNVNSEIQSNVSSLQTQLSQNVNEINTKLNENENKINAVEADFTSQFGTSNGRIDSLEAKVMANSIPVYKIVSNYCGSKGSLTFASTCKTVKCGQGNAFYKCNGACRNHVDYLSPDSCANAVIGYVIPK